MIGLDIPSRELYLRLLRHVLPYRGAFLCAVLAMIVAAATEPALPALLKPMLDGTFVRKDASLVALIPLALVGLFALRGLATFLSKFGINWVGNKVVMDLREQMFERLLRLPTRYYDDHASGNVISKLAFDVAQVTLAASSVVTDLVTDSLVVTGLLGWLLYLNWKLTLVTLIAAPPIAYIVRRFSTRLRDVSREAQRAMGGITSVIGEAIDGERVVKIFGGQPHEAKRFHEASNRVRRYNMKQAAAAAANVPLVQLVAAAAVAVIVYLATLQSHADETTVGGFVSFIVAMLMLLAPLKRLSGVTESLQRGIAAAESVFDLIDEKPEPDSGTMTLTRANGELCLEGVGFSYPRQNRSALSDINLRIRPGETVALVGQSGSGKTTLVNLIPRFYSPTRGRVLVDGHDVETLTLESLRANIALVSQDVVLFNDTVAANIAYGPMKTATEQEIVRAADAAHAMEFIRNLPQGLHTLIGEHGARLSGGQRQRMAIARALLKDAPILLLDEATSALDSESERHVQAALETLMRGRTTIVIAHRLSTIENANRIVVLHEGRITETGTHHDLLAKGGIYATLYRIQFEPAESVAVREA